MFMLIKALIFVIIAILAFFAFFFVGKAPGQEKILWGVNFSQKQADSLGLKWKEIYSAMISDLKPKAVKISVHWDLIEPQFRFYIFSDLDWQVKEAALNKTTLILAVGMKTPRWPECHVPKWAESLSKEEREARILEMIEAVVLRYRDFSNISAWQVENEPFFNFGECPKTDEKFLEEEVILVKNLDLARRPIIISDSGEGSFWLKAAEFGDILGTTIYRKLWSKEFKTYFSYPFPAVFYHRKSLIVKKFFNKDVIATELQAEPWGAKPLQELSEEDINKTMSFEQFRENIGFARKTGFKTFYLWGAEWWYYMKEKNSDPRYWEEAKKLFVE